MSILFQPSTRFLTLSQYILIMQATWLGSLVDQPHMVLLSCPQCCLLWIPKLGCMVLGAIVHLGHKIQAMDFGFIIGQIMRTRLLARMMGQVSILLSLRPLVILPYKIVVCYGELNRGHGFMMLTHHLVLACLVFLILIPLIFLPPLGLMPIPLNIGLILIMKILMFLCL